MEFLADHEKEVFTIMNVLFDEEYIVSAFKKEFIDEGKAEGLAEGVKKNKIAMIINLFKNGVPLSVIASSAFLSI